MLRAPVDIGGGAKRCGGQTMAMAPGVEHSSELHQAHISRGEALDVGLDKGIDMVNKRSTMLTMATGIGVSRYERN